MASESRTTHSSTIRPRRYRQLAMVRWMKPLAGSTESTRCEERKASSPRASQMTSSAWPMRSGVEAIRMSVPATTSSTPTDVP